MTEPTNTPLIDMTPLEAVDVIAVERRARELRAQAFADLMRATGRWIAGRFAGTAPTGARPAA